MLWETTVILNAQLLVSLHTLQNVRADYISTNDFLNLGSSCHFLISPLKNNMSHGVHKGTGSIADANLLKRKLLLPNFVDTNLEFESFCFYYSSHVQLAFLIEDLISRQDFILYSDLVEFSSLAISSNFARLLD